MPRLLAALSLSLASTLALAAEAGSCPARFEDFLARFAAEPGFQLQNTRFPLQASRVDGSAQPEPQTVRYVIDRPSDARYAKLRYPSAELQASTPLVRAVHTKGTQTRVQLSKPDTDHQQVYSFEKTARCWRLTQVDDHSL